MTRIRTVPPAVDGAGSRAALASAAPAPAPRLRAVLVQHPESVAIIPVDGDQVVLVRQTRLGAPERTLELPSGKLEPGETPEQAVTRELAEECGLAARSIRELAAFWAVPAYSTEYVHVFLATGLVRADAAALDDDEDVEVERLPIASALAELSDAVSVAAFAIWQLER
jgi:ADP-ribose pyrophosphatase